MIECYFKNRKGAVLIWVLFVFIMLMLFTTTMFYIERQNIFEAKTQEERLQTYYIALAGIDLTYAALMELNGDNPKIDDSIINKIGNGSVEQKIDIITEGEKRGTAIVTIDRIEESVEGKKKNWLRIISVGQIEGKDMKVKSTMRINEKRISQIVRER